MMPLVFPKITITYSYKCNDDSYLEFMVLSALPKNQYYDEPWVVAVMVPEEDIVNSLLS